MSQNRRIFQNTLAQSAGKILAIGIGLLTLNLLTSHLAEKGFGQYSTVLAFMGFFAIFADLGLYLVVTREISKPDADAEKTISNALGLRLAASLAALLLGAAAALFFPYAPEVKQAMLVAAAAFLFVPLNQVLLGVFQKHLATHLPSLSELAGRLLNLLLVYCFVLKALPLPFFLLALFGGNALTLLLTLLFARRYERFGIGFEWSVWKRLLSAGWPLAFAVVLNLLYFKTDTIILSLFRPAEEVGVYGLPYKILEVLLAFPAMFVGLYMPLLSRAAFDSWGEFRAILQKAFDTLLLAVVPLLVVTWFFAGEVVGLIKGPREYADSPQLLRILIVAMAIIFLGTLFGYAVTAANRQKTMVWGYLCGAAVGLTLYFALIPRFGYFGAAYGTVATEAVVALFAYTLVRKATGGGVSWRLLLKIAPAGAALAGFFAVGKMPWGIEMALGLLMYVVLLLIFKAVPLSFVKEILSRG